MNDAGKAELTSGRVRDRRRLLGVFAVVYFLAQLIVAAHDPTFAGELIDHIPSECAACLAGGASDDPHDLVPKLTEVSVIIAAADTAIPEALLTDLTVRAAAPRAPPSR
jgi:hypothetical protein